MQMVTLKRLLLLVILIGCPPGRSNAAEPSKHLPQLVQGSRGWAVGIVQSLLNDQLPAERRLAVDGILGPKTAMAVQTFNRDNKLPGAIKVDQATWQRLFGDGSKYMLHFLHVPSVVDDKATDLREDYYQSTVTLWRCDRKGVSLVGTYRGSILPQDTSRNANPPQGRAADGVYDIQLGFHRRSRSSGQAVTVSAADMRVKFSTDSPYVRPCLVVARDGVVRVTSSNPNKRTATYIHVHDAPPQSRSSRGCQTLPEADYRRFISYFLRTYPDLADWQSPGNPYLGKDIGVLVVETRSE